MFFWVFVGSSRPDLGLIDHKGTNIGRLFLLLFFIPLLFWTYESRSRNWYENIPSNLHFHSSTSGLSHSRMFLNGTLRIETLGLEWLCFMVDSRNWKSLLASPRSNLYSHTTQCLHVGLDVGIFRLTIQKRPSIGCRLLKSPNKLFQPLQD